MPEDALSYQYHSLRFYDGTRSYENVPYRIGDNITTVRDETERYYDTWADFHLIPSSCPTVGIPSPVTKLVTIPGKSTPLDLSTYLTGYPTFGNCSGSWSFITDVDFIERRLGGWIAFNKTLQRLFHGRITKVVLLDDPSYFYAGELSVNPWQTGDSYSTVTISYNLYPYKKSIQSTMELWKFDTFDFRDGVIVYCKDMEIEGSRTVKIFGSKERISPHISGSSGLIIDKYENNTWVSYGNVPTQALSSVGSIIPRLIIDDGENLLRFRGNGTVTIDYRRGLL